MKKAPKIIVASMLIFLTGCSAMNSRFDCSNKPGVTCKSIGQVNDMVDSGMLGSKPSSIGNKKTEKPSYLDINRQNLSSRFNALRAGEEVVRIWVAPYQDVHSNYHNESTLYTVVRKNNWVAPKEVGE
jgi:hypothetical protein